MCVGGCFSGGGGGGGSTTAKQRNKEKEGKGDRLEEGVNLRARMREEKDLAKIGRPISAAAARLPLTACSCELVLGMTANGLPGTLA